MAAIFFKCRNSRNTNFFKVTRKQKLIFSTESTKYQISLNDDIKKIKSSITPKLTKSQIENIITISSVELHLPLLFHSQITKDGIVKKWEQIEITKDTVKYNLADLFYTVNNIPSHLPNSSIYVFEQKLIKAKNLKMMPAILTQSNMESMLFTLLCNRPNNSTAVTIKTNAIATFFKLKIGNERVSCHDLVSNIIKGEEQYNNLVFNQEDIKQFNQSKSIEKELLGNILLRSLAIYEIIKD